MLPIAAAPAANDGREPRVTGTVFPTVTGKGDGAKIGIGLDAVIGSGEARIKENGAI
jgi:hypothetical protein